MWTYGTAMILSDNKTVPCVLPFYPAETQNSLERGSRPYTVTEILRGVFGEDFQKSIQKYMDRCPYGAAKAIGVDGARDFRLAWLGEPRVESSVRQPACTTAVDLVFQATVEAVVPSGIQPPNVEVMVKRRYPAEFRVRYLLKMWDKRCSAPLVAPSSLFPADRITEQKEGATNQYLLPVMYAADYVSEARRMLELYYPEALEGPTPVSGMVLAERMHLDVQRVRFEPGSDILGRIYFARSTVRVRNAKGNTICRDIPPMTILINTDLCPTAEIENSTIVHECCHVFLDMLFFRLQMLSGKPFTSYTSRKRKKGMYAKKNGPVDWMELQAEKLPAYILMEEGNTKREIERLLAERGGIRSPENMSWVLCQLAAHFKVSRSMAKYRMIELGYTEAEGIYAYVDKTRIPDYGCFGTWERGVTYAISLVEAGALIRESGEFADALQSGCYTYVEGHFCLDVEPYIERNRRLEKRLSAYARHHIEECCIAFSVRGRYADAEYRDAQAARKTPVKDKYQSRHSFDAEPESRARVKQNTLFVRDSQIWNDLKSAMPDNIPGAIQKILDEKGVSQEELAMRLGVSRTAWRKWCVQKISKRHIVAVCIALDVRADVGLELIRLAGHAFTKNKEDDLLMAMLYETRDLSVARANEIMRQQGMPPLTEGADEELAV